VYANKSVEQWVIEWAHWYLSQTSCRSAEQDTDGSQCTLYQDADSPVFFLAPGDRGTRRSECRIPHRKALLVPLIHFIADGSPSPLGQSVPASGLEQQAFQVRNSMRDLLATVDDFKPADLSMHMHGPTRFEHVIPPAPNYYSCAEYQGISGLIAPVYVAGYFLLLPPPVVGDHVIEHGGTLSYLGWDLVSEVSDSFVVE
jgi:hypothetical protein